MTKARPRLIAIYRSPRVAEMYLYVAREVGLDRVPEALLTRFGKPGLVTVLPITPTRRLARADATDVLQAVDTAGFYLQMPPPPAILDKNGLRRDAVFQAPDARPQAPDCGTTAP